MLRVGVLGCGKIAQVRHIPEYAANGNVRLVAYYNPTISRAKEMAEKYGGRAVASAEELLADPPAEEVLLVGHGASVGAATRFLAEKANFTGNWGISFNAALCTFEIAEDGTVKLLEPWGVEHMPIEKVTSNKRSYEEVINQ